MTTVSLNELITASLPQGYTGSFGFNGYTGSLGYTGSAGYIGVDGYAGSTGYTGSIGYTGSVGYTGSLGYTGSAGYIGVDGYAGSTGYTGSKGDPGSFGGASFEYIFDTSTVVSDPGSGRLKLNDSTYTSASNLSISFVDVNSSNIYSFLQTIDDSTSPIKGHFSLYDLSNTSNYLLFSIVGNHIHQGGSFNVPISFVSGHPSSLANNTNVEITFARTGDIGETGYTGSLGFTGYTGSLGTAGYTGSTGYTGSVGSIAPKSLSIPYPNASETVTFFYTSTERTVTKIASILVPTAGATPSVTFSVKYGLGRNSTGTEIVTGGITTSNTSNGTITTSFNNATISENSWVWLTTSAATANTEELHVTLEF